MHFILFIIIILKKEREHMSPLRGEEEAGSLLRREPDAGLKDHDLSRKQLLNQLSDPYTQYPFLICRINIKE